MDQEQKNIEMKAAAEERGEEQRARGDGGGGILGTLVVGVVVVVLVLGGVGVWYWIRGQRAAAADEAAKQALAAANRPVPVVAVATRAGDLPIYLKGLGNVVPLNTVTVRARVDGQLMKVNYVEGQMVEMGSELALIDPRPFEAVLEQSRAQKARDEAQKVKDLALKAKDEAVLANARLDLARYEAAGEAASQMQRDTAAATVKQDAATVAQDDAAVAQDDAAAQADQAAIDSAALNITYCHIICPVTGRIGLRMVDAGNMVHAADANGLAVITQMQPITVVFALDQSTLPTVQGAMRAAGGGKLGATAWDKDLRVKLGEGELAALDNQVDPTTGSYKLKAVFANGDEALYPNQFVNVWLLVDTRKGVVLGPTAALQRSPSSSYAFVVKDLVVDGKAVLTGEGKAVQAVEMRPIKVGPTEGETAVIEEGISAGEVVVTDGVDKLQAGTRVTVAGSATQAGTQAASGAGTRGAGGRKGR